MGRKRKKINPSHLTYAGRNAAVVVIGYTTYEAYTTGPLWGEIRERVFRTAGTGCPTCGGAATQVHHRAYTVENLTGASIDGLVPICVQCHHYIEFYASGIKRSIVETDKAYRRLVKRRKHPEGRRGPKAPAHLVGEEIGKWHAARQKANRRRKKGKK